MSETATPPAEGWIPRSPEGGRRPEDIELRKFIRNRWFRRVGTVVFALVAFVAGGLRDEWNRIPSTQWTTQVNEAVANASATRGKLTELNIRVDNLQQAIEQNTLQDTERQREVLAEIRGLRSDVKQAVKDAAAAATQAARGGRQ